MPFLFVCFWREENLCTFDFLLINKSSKNGWEKRKKKKVRMVDKLYMQ
jgi:hypothetical protein